MSSVIEVDLVTGRVVEGLAARWARRAGRVAGGVLGAGVVSYAVLWAIGPLIQAGPLWVRVVGTCAMAVWGLVCVVLGGGGWVALAVVPLVLLFAGITWQDGRRRGASRWVGIAACLVAVWIITRGLAAPAEALAARLGM